MNRSKRHLHRSLRRALAAGMLWYTDAALAANGGCQNPWHATYQIGVTTKIVVTNDIPAGHPVLSGRATGDGGVLGSCYEGLATFEADHGEGNANLIGGLVPLTVGGKPSGFGIELRLKEWESGVEYPFPHKYQRSFDNGDPLRANDVEVAYVVKRMAGPIAFGAIDQVGVGRQWTYLPNGNRNPPLRLMEIKELELVRPACSMVAEDLNQTVKLGAYNASNFATTDRATPWVPFHLRVEECQEPAGLLANFTFGTSADAVVGQPDLFTLDGPKNVGLELADDAKKNIAPGATTGIGALGTGETYTFNARLRETQPTVRGGKFSRNVKVLVEFR